MTHAARDDGRAAETDPRGPSVAALFSHGFRPFFLGAALYAVVLMSVWAVWLAGVYSGGGAWLKVAGSPFAWHAHEMAFGFIAAAIAGFLLTAVPNWTGALPLSGPPLALLFLLWIAGRIAMAFSAVMPPMAVASIDIAFVPVLGAFAAKQLFVKPALRNLVFLLILSLLTGLNGLYHARVAEGAAGDPIDAIRTALLVIMVMVTIVGGRIVPAFTHNWLHLSGVSEKMPVRFPRLDAASVLLVALYSGAILLQVPPLVAGMVALLAALANAGRLFLWRGIATVSEPIVWILHLGYLWLVVGLALSAAALLTGAMELTLASHAFAVGAAGTMIMAVMSRASLGHTGRVLVAPRPVVYAYYAITIAALLRVFGPLVVPAQTPLWLSLSALAWIVAFGLFVWVYGPILMTERVRVR